MKKNKSKKIKSEKGSITLFVLVTVLFFIIILVLSYATQANKINMQKKQIQKIQSEYNADGEMEEVYLEIINKLPKTEIS